MQADQTGKTLRREAREWTAVILCLSSAAYTYWTATIGGIDVCSPLLRSCALWVFVGAWLGNFFKPTGFVLLQHKAPRKVIAVSFLSKSILQGSASLLAAYIIFRMSQAFV